MKMKRAVILHLCILISFALIVRCDDDQEEEEEEEQFNNDKMVNYPEFDAPTKEYTTDQKIISRNVKCLGKLLKFIVMFLLYHFDSIQCAKQQS